jgi:hypothetical protein
MHGHDQTTGVQAFLHTLMVFEVEFLTHLQEWDDLLRTIGVGDALASLAAKI